MLQLTLFDLQAVLTQRLDDVYSPRGETSDGNLSPWRRTVLETLEPDRLTARREPSHISLREGGTWSGPAQFEMIDMMGFLLCVANLPPESDALTISITVNFLQAPPFEDLLAEARMLRMSRRSAVLDVILRSASIDGVAVKATVSYLCLTGTDVPRASAEQSDQIKEGASCT